MNTIIFVRHGRSEANAQKMIATPQTPLHPEGRAQAKATAAALKGEGITAIATSPDVRARQTAEIIAAELGFDNSRIQVINDLHERGFGQKEGGPKDHESAWYYTVDDEFGIESHQALIARMQRAARQLKKLAAQQNGMLAVIGHATAGFYLQQVLRGRASFATFDPPEEMTNAGFVRLEV